MGGLDGAGGEGAGRGGAGGLDGAGAGEGRVDSTCAGRSSRLRSFRNGARNGNMSSSGTPRSRALRSRSASHTIRASHPFRSFLAGSFRPCPRGS